MNLLNRKGFFRSRVNEVVNKKEDSQVKNMWLSIVSCIALLVSTSVFASNAINNGNIIQNIDEIVDDVNIKNKIKLIDDFFYGLESDVLKIEEFYYDKGLNEYTVNLQFIEENPPEYDNKMHKLLSEFAKSNDLKITKSITFYSIDTVSIFDNDLVSNSPGNINIGNYNYGFNLGDEKETKIVKSLNDFEVDSVSSLTKLGSISKYNRSNNGLFAIFTMQYKIDKNCKYRFEFLWENSGIKTDRNIVTYELSRFQDIQEFCRENKAVKEKQFLVFDRFDYSDSAEMIQLNEIIKMGYLTNRASHEEFNELHGDFIHSFNVEYDDYEPVITKQQRYVYSLLNKISGFVQNEVTSSMSQSYDGLYSIDGFATNLESFNAYINQIKTLAYYDFKYDYFVDENSEIRFMLILDGFAMEDALDQLSDEEIQALLNMQINTTRVFEQPSRPSPEVEAQFEAISLLPQLTLSNIEDELYNRLIDIEGIHITQITDDENFIKIQIIFETIFLHNLFIGMFYDSYPGKIIEPQPQYFQSGEIYNELILPK